MKIQFLKLKNWIILSLMGALGLGSCQHQKNVVKEEKEPVEGPKPRNEAVLLYGVPPRNFQENNIKDDDRPRPEEKQPTPVMYGVPTVNFQVKGRVVDEQGKPVKGLRVTLLSIDGIRNPQNEFYQGYIDRASDTTDDQGSFQCQTSDRPWERQRVAVIDIDGTKNGHYEEQVLSVEFPEPTGERQGWNQGTSAKEITITVKRK